MENRFIFVNVCICVTHAYMHVLLMAASKLPAVQLDKRPIDRYVCLITGVPFPKNFMSVAKTILKRLFRVYAHIYHQHFDSVMQLQEEAHLNTSFKHFIFFVQVS